MPIGPIVTDEAQGSTAVSGTNGVGTVVGGLGATVVEVEVELDGTVDDEVSTVDVVDDDDEDVEDSVPIDDVVEDSATVVELISSAPEAERSVDGDEHETNSTPTITSRATARRRGRSDGRALIAQP
ncbi:MAG: hypothetical protein FGM58_05480 [Acidimicrobiia bacterium]|nr:hypothetical protein [Acidimicrobiia bacterium]